MADYYQIKQGVQDWHRIIDELTARKRQTVHVLERLKIQDDIRLTEAELRRTVLRLSEAKRGNLG